MNQMHAEGTLINITTAPGWRWMVGMRFRLHGKPKTRTVTQAYVDETGNTRIEYGTTTRRPLPLAMSQHELMRPVPGDVMLSSFIRQMAREHVKDPHLTAIREDGLWRMPLTGASYLTERDAYESVLWMRSVEVPDAG